MRWETQKLHDDSGPALLPMAGLVRSVQTPDFDGVTFHEVAAKTALNKVPNQSNMPFRWTINPMRGCLHQCRYCLSPDTLIMMADGRQRRLDKIRVGDKIIGTHLSGRYRYYTETEVNVVWRTRKPAYRVTLEDGTELIASGNHRFLTECGWKHVAPPAPGEGQRPYLTTNNSLLGFGKSLITSEVPEILGQGVETADGLKVSFVEALGQEQTLVDITTGTGDFIANGVISHNCFARKTHEYLDLDAGKDFDSQIVVKTNVADVLRAELAKPSWGHEHVALGTNTDPYQRAEGRYRLMPGIIQALADSGTPFSILTKGPLLKRDLPLLQEAAKKVPVSVAVSLAVMDTELQQMVEPGTPDSRARLSLIKSITDAGLECNVLAMPILPWLTDSATHLDSLHGALAAAGASWVSTGALHLRPGAREWFMQWLQQEFPKLVPKYRRLYRGKNGQFTTYASAEYKKWLGQQAAQARRHHGFIKREDFTWRGRTSPEQPNAPTEAVHQPTLEAFAAPAQPALF